MGIRPRTKAAKKRRVRLKEERRQKKFLSRVHAFRPGYFFR